MDLGLYDQIEGSADVLKLKSFVPDLLKFHINKGQVRVSKEFSSTVSCYYHLRIIE